MAAPVDTSGLRDAVEQIHDVADCLLSYKVALVLYQDRTSKGGVQAALLQASCQADEAQTKAQTKPLLIQEVGSAGPSGVSSQLLKNQPPDDATPPLQNANRQQDPEPETYYT